MQEVYELDLTTLLIAVLNVHHISYPKPITVPNLRVLLGNKNALPVYKTGAPITDYLEQRLFFYYEIGAGDKELVSLYSVYATKDASLYVNFCLDKSQCRTPDPFGKNNKTLISPAQNPVVIVDKQQQSLKNQNYMFVEMLNSTYVQDRSSVPILFQATVYTERTVTADGSTGLDGVQIAGIVMISIVGATVLFFIGHFFYQKRLEKLNNDYESAHSEYA